MTEMTDIIQRLGLALCLGLLVGMQREKVHNAIAGIRTFALITLFGALCALLSAKFGPILIAVGLGTLAALLLIANYSNLKKASADEIEPGITTEVASLIMYCIGAYTVVGSPQIAICLSAGIVVLLYLKKSLHAMLRKIGDRDMKAIMQFVLIALVILPILPNRTFGPFNVLNPFEIWLTVALIMGISLAAYFVYKMLGTKVGVALAAGLGGLISSTATTISYAQKAKDSSTIGKLAATAIVIASAMAFVRIIFEITIIAPSFALQMVWPFVLVLFVLMSFSLLLLNHPPSRTDIPEPENPAEFKSAITFGLIYAVISLAVAATKQLVGNEALFLVGALSGLTDVDALTLTTTRQVLTGGLEPTFAWQVILVGATANLICKAGIALFIARPLFKYLAPSFGTAIAVALLTVFFLPSLSPQIADLLQKLPI